MSQTIHHTGIISCCDWFLQLASSARWAGQWTCWLDHVKGPEVWVRRVVWGVSEVLRWAGSGRHILAAIEVQSVKIGGLGTSHHMVARRIMPDKTWWEAELNALWTSPLDPAGCLVGVAAKSSLFFNWVMLPVGLGILSVWFLAAGWKLSRSVMWIVVTGGRTKPRNPCLHKCLCICLCCTLWDWYGLGLNPYR